MYNVLYTSSQNGEIKVYLSTAMIFSMQFCVNLNDSVLEKVLMCLITLVHTSCQ